MNTTGGPAEVKGYYENRRGPLHAALMFIFFMIPWVHLDGQPIFLFNFLERHFIFFGVSFFSHEAPLLFFLLILMLLIIFMVTAVFGRLWCGWACPQTVFLHSVYFKIEKIILGTFSERYKFYANESKDLNYFLKLGAMYFAFMVVSFVLAHSFAAYFIGSNKITAYITQGPANNLMPFFILMISTGALFLNFTFFREKLCMYICPYGRFQNSLIDRFTWVVYYDSIRGEPRKPQKLTDSIEQNAETGDCVNCLRCVRVCPVKIDIRDGFSLDCISCAKCMDACDEVMLKTHKLPRLIRFESLSLKKGFVLRFRLILYTGLFFIFLLAFTWTLFQRQMVDFVLVRPSGEVFTQRQEGVQMILQNRLQIHLKNQTSKKLNVKVQLSKNTAQRGFYLISSIGQIQLEALQDIKAPLFIEIAEQDYIQKQNHLVQLELVLGDDIKTQEIQFIKGL